MSLLCKNRKFGTASGKLLRCLFIDHRKGIVQNVHGNGIFCHLRYPLLLRSHSTANESKNKVIIDTVKNEGSSNGSRASSETNIETEEDEMEEMFQAGPSLGKKIHLY